MILYRNLMRIDGADADNGREISRARTILPFGQDRPLARPRCTRSGKQASGGSPNLGQIGRGGLPAF